MDSRHQNQDNNQHPHTYGFNPSHADSFNSFLHADNEPSFTNSWDPEAFVDPQDSINAFNPGNSTWDQSALQPSHLLPVASYGVQPRNLDQTFSGNPSGFGYSGFDSRANLSMPPSFDTTLAYGHVALTDDPNFDFTRNSSFQRPPKQADTVSPQALQNYPATFNHVQVPEARPVSFPLALPSSIISKSLANPQVVSTILSAHFDRTASFDRWTFNPSYCDSS